MIRELGRYPTSSELRLRETTDPTFPSVFSRVAKRPWVEKTIAYCLSAGGHDDVVEVCRNTGSTNRDRAATTPSDGNPETGYVYLALIKVGREKRFKIGKADIVGRRTKQAGLNQPEDLELVHTISTDDAYGIENYWHRRFAAQRRGGEWFDLAAADVKAFKRRKFM